MFRAPSLQPPLPPLASPSPSSSLPPLSITALPLLLFSSSVLSSSRSDEIFTRRCFVPAFISPLDQVKSVRTDTLSIWHGLVWLSSVLRLEWRQSRAGWMRWGWWARTEHSGEDLGFKPRMFMEDFYPLLLLLLLWLWLWLLLPIIWEFGGCRHVPPWWRSWWIIDAIKAAAAAERRTDRKNRFWTSFDVLIQIQNQIFLYLQIILILLSLFQLLSLGSLFPCFALPRAVSLSFRCHSDIDHPLLVVGVFLCFSVCSILALLEQKCAVVWTESSLFIPK